MRIMRISVRWKKEIPKAVEIASLVSQEVGFTITPEIGGENQQPGLVFECISLGSGNRNKLENRGMAVAILIRTWLFTNYRVFSTIFVEGMILEDYTCLLERRIRLLEGSMRKVAVDFNQIGSMFRD